MPAEDKKPSTEGKITTHTTAMYDGMQQAYHRAVNGPKASMNETTDQKMSRIKKQYPYGSIEGGRKTPKF